MALQVYFTLEVLGGGRWEHREQGHAMGDADGPLRCLVHRTVAGQVSGEEQALVAFDRALATSGAVSPSNVQAGPGGVYWLNPVCCLHQGRLEAWRPRAG